MPNIRLTPEQAAKVNLRNPAALAAAARGDMEDAIAASTPGGILAQEAAGQRMLVDSGALLPKRTTGIGDGPTREQITAETGIVFGDDKDDLFVNVTLPAGWKIEATGHSMWSKVLDANGIERAEIFYKAAFYDRSAHCYFHQRFNYENDYAEPIASIFVKDRKTGQVVYTAGTVTSEQYSLREELYGGARTWLEKHYPNYRDPFAYWEDQ